LPAAIIFFAFYGFDAISTAAGGGERNPKGATLNDRHHRLHWRFCTVIYMVIAALLPWARTAPSWRFSGAARSRWRSS